MGRRARLAQWDYAHAVFVTKAEDAGKKPSKK